VHFVARGANGSEGVERGHGGDWVLGSGFDDVSKAVIRNS